MTRTHKIILGGFIGGIVGLVSPLVLAWVLWKTEKDPSVGGAATFLPCLTIPLGIIIGIILGVVVADH